LDSKNRPGVFEFLGTTLHSLINGTQRHYIGGADFCNPLARVASGMTPLSRRRKKYMALFTRRLGSIVAVASLAFAGVASAQFPSYSQEVYVGPLTSLTEAKSTLSRAEVKADLQAYQQAAAGQTHSREVYPGLLPQTKGTLSRAEVQADLNLWNRAGLGAMSQGENTPGADPVYAERLAVYQNLRSGPEYQAELRRLSGSTMAGTAATTSVQ
jgi:hypothetical protein